MSAAAALRVMPLIALAGCALLTQKKAWPVYEGEVVAKGPTAPVTVTRDQHGVPHIRAQTPTDAVYALGFAHAQDRLFQADLTRRLIYGELSTLLGERSVELDGFVQGLGVRARADQAVKRAPFETQTVLEAYSLGFNAGRDSLAKLPVEYGLLGVEQVPDWTPADCVANAYLQSYNLAENPTRELAALALSDLDAATLDQLLRFEAETPALDPYWDELRTAEIGPFTTGWNAWAGVFGGVRDSSTEASNNWVVGPERSRSGKPIVANDPHLGQRVPSIWYAADIKGGEMHVAGVTFPGTPAVVIGHNEHVAWGLTNVMADYVDLVVYETRDGGEAIVVAGETVPLRAEEHQIAVKKGEPVSRTTWWTPTGPVITDRDADHVVALRWHALELEGEETTAFWGLNRATSVQEALDAMNRPLIVAQNLVVADVSGDYAWQAVGSVPVRKQHTGRVPYPGSDPAHGWDGWYEALPGERSPERGWVATANERPLVDQPAGPATAVEGGELPEPVDEADAAAPIAVHGISTGWAQRWRRDRIDEQLGANSSWTPEAVSALQTDVRDLQAATLIPALLEGVEGGSSGARRCRNLLASWDFEVDADSVGPTVWMVFQRELLREVLADDITEAGFEVYLQVHSPARNLLSVNLDHWTDDRPDAVDSALTAACSKLESTLGESEEGWLWGDVHVLALRHPFGDSSFLLKGWNAPERRFAGNGSTIAAASTGWRDGEQFVGGMASMRLVMPLDDLAASTLVHPGGQSGLPGHPLAFTHFDAFVAGETLPLYFADGDVFANATHTLTLMPPGGRKKAPEPAPAAEVEEGAASAEGASEPGEAGAEPAEAAAEPAEAAAAPAEAAAEPAEAVAEPAEKAPTAQGGADGAPAGKAAREVTAERVAPADE